MRVFQRAGIVHATQKTVCIRFQGAHLLEGAGHWVQQEQSGKISDLLVRFLRGTRA